MRAAALWQRPLPRMAGWLDSLLAAVGGPGGGVSVFFRADDVAVPGEALGRLLALFEGRKVPLALAVVPAWLTRDRWSWIQDRCTAGSPSWCWHQHGWRHVNHEPTGRKQEFGPSRTARELRKDIAAGRRRLEDLLGGFFTPIFTPPWNRCGPEALAVLAQEGYIALSRTRDAEPPSPGIPDVGVGVDLHTRKERRFEDAWRGLRENLETGLSRSPCGIMIHHRCMNDPAFAFLEALLAALQAHPSVRLENLRNLAAAQNPEVQKETSPFAPAS